MAKLVSVEVVGYSIVYDLEIQGTHNFAVNGLVVHNSSSDPNF